jgi:hypothetical protein
MNTSFKDAAAGLCETRQHNRGRTHSAFGRSYCHIRCPFCLETVTAYIWSLSGGGKRCLCGAIHDSMGNTYKRKE